LQTEQQVADMKKDLDRNGVLLRKMQEQMQQVLTPHQPSPSFHLSEATLGQVNAVTCETITVEIEPAIMDFKFAVQHQIGEQHRQIYQDLWKKLQPSRELTGHIYKWLQSQLQKQTA
jgi:hypothetical protein